MDPNNTTIAALKTVIIDQFLAQCDGRVLRDYLPSSAVTLVFGGHKLEDEDLTLIEYGITQNSTLNAIRAPERETRKRYGKGFDDDPAIELRKKLEKQRKREERKEEKKEKARKGAEEMAELLQREAEAAAEAETDEENQRMEQVREEAEDGIVVVEEQFIVEELRQETSFQIRSENERQLVDYEVEDPPQEDDADKENWDPQILREQAVHGVPATT